MKYIKILKNNYLYLKIIFKHSIENILKIRKKNMKKFIEKIYNIEYFYVCNIFLFIKYIIREKEYPRLSVIWKYIQDDALEKSQGWYGLASPCGSAPYII